MDSIKQQIFELDLKVHQMYQLIERLSAQVNVVIAQNASLVDSDYSLNSLVVSNVSLINHQDVLIDDRGENLNSINQDPIDPQIQIRRLTAQLTAAYNRIASLEEQLMYKRTNH